MTAPAIYLDNLRFRDWPSLYKIAKHPRFFYRALNDKNACVAFRAARYICKAKLGKSLPSFERRTVKAIHLADTSEMIGCVVLAGLHQHKYGQAETGIFIAFPYQGKGIAKTARLRFIDWCLAKFDIQNIESYAHPDNAASIRIQEIGGLRQAGAIDASQKLYFGRDGSPEPRVIMSASRAEIEKALQQAREAGLYSRAIPVL